MIFENGDSVRRASGGSRVYQVAEALKVAGGSRVYKLHGSDELHLESDLVLFTPPRFEVQGSTLRGFRVVDTTTGQFSLPKAKAEEAVAFLNELYG